MSNDNLRNLISSIREIQDLGELVSGRNIFNININYYENYHTGTTPSSESNIPQTQDLNIETTHNNQDQNNNNQTNTIHNTLLSPVSNEGAENSVDSEILDDSFEEEILESSGDMSIDDENNRNISNINYSYFCPSGHRMTRMPLDTNNPEFTCCSCNSSLANIDFYRCLVCQYNRCQTCLLRRGDYIDNRNPINNNSTESLNNTSIYIPYTTSLTRTLNISNSTNSLNGLENITSIVRDSVVNSFPDNYATIDVTVTSPAQSRYNNNIVTVQDLLTNSSILLIKDIQNPESKCHICNENYGTYDICRRLSSCNHYYHFNCIDNWLTSNRNCPICNTNI